MKENIHICITESLCHTVVTGLPRWLSGKDSTCQCRRHRFSPWVRKIPWRWAWQPTPVFLPGESPWTEEPGGLQSMGSNTTEQLSTQHKKSRTRSFLAGAKWLHIPSGLNLLFPLGGSLTSLYESRNSKN